MLDIKCGSLVNEAPWDRTHSGQTILSPSSPSVSSEEASFFLSFFLSFFFFLSLSLSRLSSVFFSPSLVPYRSSLLQKASHHEARQHYTTAMQTKPAHLMRKVIQHVWMSAGSVETMMGWFSHVVIWELAVLALARIMCANIHSQNAVAILAQELLFTQVRKFESFSFYPLDLCYRHVWCTCELWSRHSWGDSGSYACGGANNFGFGEPGLLSTCRSRFWRMTKLPQGLWTPRIGKWWQKWWKTQTMLPPTSCRASMWSILKVQLLTCRTPLRRWCQPWRRWSWVRLPAALKPLPGRRVWLPLRRSPLVMRHLWMIRWWSRPHTSGRSLAGVPHPLHSSWQTYLSCMRRWPRTSSWWWTSWALKRSTTFSSSSAIRRVFQLWAFGRVVKAYVAMKAQKVHDEIMKHPHVAGRSRPGIGSDTLKENTQPESYATHQCPECFTDWPAHWDPTNDRMCVCGKMVFAAKKTKHLVNMDHPTGNWLLFMTGNGITWEWHHLRHAVDIGMLAEAPLCPADHAETSLSDFVLLRTEVLNRVVDAETFPSEAQSRPQNSKDCKKDQAALVFHPDAAAAMALAGKLTGADVPPEEAFHPKRPEAEMLKVVQDNADILHDMQSGAMSVEDPQGAEALRHLDMVKFKEVLKRKFLEGPGSNQSAWEALNRSMVDLDTAKTKNREYEQARRAYKQFLTPPPGNPSIWGEELQQLIEAGFFCPLTGMRKPSPDLDQSNAIGEYVKAKHMIAELRQQAYPAKLLTEVPQCPAGHACGNRDPRQVLSHGSQKIGARISWGQGGPSSPYDQHVRWRDPAACWQVEENNESTEVPTWSKLPQPVWEAAQALERRTHPTDQGSNFVEFHLYTDEELEDHRRLGLRPYWSYLKGNFFA